MVVPAAAVFSSSARISSRSPQASALVDIRSVTAQTHLSIFLRTSPSRDRCKKENWHTLSLKKIHIPKRKQKCLPIEFFRELQSALKAVQNLIAPQEFVSIRGEVRSVNEGPAEHSGAPPVTSLLHLVFT